jgi:hypothetical protein
MKPCLGHFPLRSDVYQPYISDPTIRMNPYVYKRPAETLPPVPRSCYPCRPPPPTHIAVSSLLTTQRAHLAPRRHPRSLPARHPSTSLDER